MNALLKSGNGVKEGRKTILLCKCLENSCEKAVFEV